jgi:NCAIR mutase (PurE)-related protein
LLDVKNGDLSVSEAMQSLSILPFEDIGFAKVDHHRDLRTGFPEVVYGPGKTVQQLVDIARSINNVSSKLLITRVEYQAYEAIKAVMPDAQYNEIAKAIIVGMDGQKRKLDGISVVAAGTSDIPVAEEAALTAELIGNEVDRIWDVGIAGLHRLLSYLPALQESRVIVAVAGMEGALPSLVGGLVTCPVIAVPTSVGYGANLQGLSALLAMLNACSPGISVVNIDNGFGAGYLAGMINSMVDRRNQS